MNRFNIFTRPPNPTTTAATNPSSSTTRANPLFSDPYSDLTPLSPHLQPEILDDSDDLEAQSPAAARATREMAQRQHRPTSFLQRLRPAIPSFLSYGGNGYPRPTSSEYSDSGAGLRGAPDTVINGGGGRGGGYGNLDDESPKSPEFRIGEADLRLPGTRLHLPNLARTWSVGENGPPTRPGTGVTGNNERGEGVARPERVVHARRHRERGEEHRERRRRRRGEGERSGSGRSRSDRSGSDRSGSDRSGSGHSRSHSGSHRSRGSRDAGSGSGRERRERHERRERRRREVGERGSSASTGRRDRRPPKNFLFCFPWIKSRRIRSQILRAFVSGLFLTLTLAVYLSLSLTKNISSNEFMIVMIIIILFVTIFFCHSVIRLCMMVVKSRKREQAVARGQLPEMAGPGGYAIPREPIPVVLARDEEAAGIESEATKTGPPAYGVWRESVRVDPNRLYWMRNEHARAEEVSDISSSSSGSGSSQSSRGRANVPRPPSYSSDDGVSYVVEARPRSVAPQANGRLVGSSHPSESGRSGPWI